MSSVLTAASWATRAEPTPDSPTGARSDERCPIAESPTPTLVDPITGLPTRMLLLDRLDQSLARSRTHGTRTSLVVLAVAADPDDVGLRPSDPFPAIGTHLRSTLRDDHTVARSGPDELAVVAEHPDGTGRSIAILVRDLAREAATIPHARIRVAWATSDGQVETRVLLTHAIRRLHEGADS